MINNINTRNVIHDFHELICFFVCIFNIYNTQYFKSH